MTLYYIRETTFQIVFLIYLFVFPVKQELLVATRHILSTEFREAFINKIDILLDEKVLVGTGVTSHDTLRHVTLLFQIKFLIS